MAQTVLVVGTGGREHALAWALSKDPGVAGVHIAPGNPGTAAVGTNHPVDPMNPEAVAALAVELAVDLVVVGPEAPLVAGVADAVRARGIPVFGPSGAAAQLEGSKAFAKEIMEAAGVPTAEARLCVSMDEVVAALDEFGAPYVVKDDGLAAGKGVIVTDDRDAAIRHAAGCRKVIIEEYLDGPEVSLFALSDGTHVLPFEPAQDFKRVGDGDAGPNTGGMGAYTPLPWAPAGLTEQVVATVIQPTIDELRRRGTPFVGLLYAGLALTSRGVRVVEFNARFGDPETQPLLTRLKTPLGGALYAAATGALAEHPPLEWGSGAAVGVVIAAQGYPESPRKGDPITGAEIEGVFHAGTALDASGQLVSAGGRVLTVVGTGDTLAEARDAAYAKVSTITLPGGFHRTDIAANAAAQQLDGLRAVPGKEEQA
ncbi:phosphoribosylamine--glycine ligase [Propionicimonas paludicola]|uniref:Phosphoribosylamine--glycine ligase n=1 Tax=Propionicimonas paludicola TaxID=185243 RepID=A0A2A9CQ23_9ACTN|nr:phosphoribosylamine--glycine ligase [Propionicimonas paludicola]PFG15712.1 phosphoribosylamine--glycine ligase [Propionicimonas paludicola]